MHSKHQHPDVTTGDHVDATLAEELAEARLALTRRLEDLARRPELLLGSSADALIGELTNAYRVALERLTRPQIIVAEVPEPEDQAPPPPAPSEPGRDDTPQETPARVDLRSVVSDPDPEPDLVKVDIGHGAEAMLSPESAALIHDLPEITRTFKDLHDVGTSDMIQRAASARVERGLPRLDDDAMADLLHMFVALLRHADTRAMDHDESARLTSSIFRTLRFDYTEERRLYIHGMALAHTPKHGMTWSDDASHWLAALEARVEAVDPDSLNEPTSSSRSKTRPDTSSPRPKISWPSTFGWSGRSIEMLGANFNPDLVEDLLELTGAKRIEWTPLQRGAPNMRLVQTMCERIERGSVDLAVIFTAFATHKATQRLKKSLQRAPHVRALWVGGVPSVKNLRDALLEHSGAHI